MDSKTVWRENDPGSRNRLFPFGTALLLILSGLLGCLAIYNSRAYGADPTVFVMRQLLSLLPCMLVFLVSAAVPFRWYRKASSWLMPAGILLLILVLVCGETVNGMRGWLRFGRINIQPSELVKTVFLLYLCVQWDQREKRTAGKTLKIFLTAGICMGLVMAEPDYGGTMMFFLIFLLIAAVGGTPLHYLLIAGGAMALASLYFLLANDYAMMRIIGFLNQESSSAWHIRQFQYTMAHGGWTGADWGKALWSGSFLPLPHTDSLYASIVESTGFLGGMLVIAGFLAMSIAFCLLSWKVKGKNNDRRYFIFAAGAVYLIQALIHISVNCVLIPPTGITLPILSYGGSSLLGVLLTFGIAFSAARSDDPDELDPAVPPAGGEPHTDPAKSPQS